MRGSLKKALVWLLGIMLVFSIMPSTAHAQGISFILDDGSITISPGSSAGTLSIGQGGETVECLSAQAITVGQDAEGALSNNIVIENGAAAVLKLDSVKLLLDSADCIEIQPGAKLKLLLSGNSELVTIGGNYSGIHVPDGAELVIDCAANHGEGVCTGGGTDCGYLKVNTGFDVNDINNKTPAGIGSHGREKSGSVVIQGGHISVRAGYIDDANACSPAGIGSGIYGDNGYISITGGFVEIENSWNGAGIGSGFGGNAGNISISGGKVVVSHHYSNIDAYGGTSCVGIGCGAYGTGGTLSITGGCIYSCGGKTNDTCAIGASYGGQMDEVTVTGGAIFATTSLGGSAIGASSNGYITSLSVFQDGAGILSLNGDARVYGSTEWKASYATSIKSLTVGEGAELTIPQGESFDTSIPLTNNGTVYCSTPLAGSGTVVNSGRLIFNLYDDIGGGPGDAVIEGNAPEYMYYYSVKVSQDVVDAVISPDKKWYQPEEKVTLTISSVTEGKLIKAVLAGSKEAVQSPGVPMEYTFTMPASPVVVTAQLIDRTYTFEASPLSLDFGQVKEGYGQQNGKTVVITNTGNTAITFENTKITTAGFVITGIPKALTPGESAQLTIAPADNLKAGSYHEKIVLNAKEGSSAAIGTDFSVKVDIPPTGDDGTKAVALMALSAAGILMLVMIRRRSRFKAET